MERLTAEDRLMLWPDERWPQDMGHDPGLDLIVRSPGCGLQFGDRRVVLIAEEFVG
jgi:hypothetical protein